MGINLALVLTHSLEAADLVAFPERAVSSIRLRRAAEQLWHVMSPRWPNLNPVNEFSTFLPEERLSASDVMGAWKQGKDLPSFWWAGFHLNFGEGAVAAIHMEKLAGFVLDLDGLRSPLQECAHALASELRSPTLVYGPDSFSPFQTTLCIEDGRSLDAMLSEANRLCGPPAATIREMADQADELNLDRDCYFVEAVHCEEWTVGTSRAQKGVALRLLSLITARAAQFMLAPTRVSGSPTDTPKLDRTDTRQPLAPTSVRTIAPIGAAPLAPTSRKALSHQHAAGTIA